MNVAKYIYIIILSYLLLSCGDANKRLYGRWVISHYAAGPISALSEEEERAFLGKELIFTKEYIIVNRLKFENPNYKFSENKADDYFYSNYRMPKDYIGIKQDLITVININITQPKNISNEVLEHREDNLFLYIDEFILCNEELILEVDGTFFYLKKDNTKTKL